MKKFKNVISLGFFCSPAMELERIGLRKSSYPFDWLIAPSFKTVINLITENFNGFLDYEQFYQLKKHPSYYRNQLCGIDFYHDFSVYKSFDKQYDPFKKKYERRISRFYKDITEPTLFIRYVSSDDAEFINSEQEKIDGILKGYNPQNEIIYIQNSCASTLIEKENVYLVEKDSGDDVARQFLNKLPSLRQYLTDNVEPAKTQLKKKSKLVKKLKKLIKKIRIKLGWYYHHNKTV